MNPARKPDAGGMKDKRGRVMGYYTMAFMGMVPFGSLLAGSMAKAPAIPPTPLWIVAGPVLAARSGR